MIPDQKSLDVEVVIVGAGISGIAAGIELLRRNQKSFVLLEGSSELGGTWRDNVYPGVAVDIPSISYCFSFEMDYPWSRIFAPGREIQAYVKHCAEKYGVTPHIRFDTRVSKSVFDAVNDCWSTTLTTGEVVTSRYLISATGLFGEPKLSEISGHETFGGKSMHTSRWEHTHDLSDQRVAVIGTGASAVQVVPEIAKDVANLTVFQRTPIWVSPRMDGPIKLGSSKLLAPLRWTLRFFSELSLDALTFSIVNYRKFPWFVRVVESVVRFSMRRQLDDPKIANALIPEYGLGCKRPATSNIYLPTFNRENVNLVTAGITEICSSAVLTEDGKLHEVDTLIFATGFATTEKGNGPSFEVVGLDGVELGQFWEDNRLQAYAGVSVSGFPNFFLTAGPYAGGFNWFAMVEANVNHIMRCMDDARVQGVNRIEIRRETHDQYMNEMWRRADGTIFKADSCLNANSYYLDSRGDASLPLPHTPWWRALRGRLKGTKGYDFG